MFAGRAGCAATLLLAMATTGCGADEERPEGTSRISAVDPAQPSLIGREDIGRAGPGSPGAAFLAWWSAMQREDARGARVAFAPGADLAGLAADVHDFGHFFRRSRPAIAEVDVNGARATVLALVRGTERHDSQVHVTETTARFALTQVDGRWRLVDDGYLEKRRRVYVEQGGRPRPRPARRR